MSVNVDQAGSGAHTQLRVWLIVLAVPALVSAVWGILAPASWYSDFGGPAAPSAFGAYNEHFVQDIGGGYLAFGAALVYAAVVLRRHVVRCALIATLGFSVPHMVIHLIDQGHLDTGGYVFVNATLIIGVAVALWSWRLTSRLD